MILVAVTRAKRKLRFLIKLALVVLLLVVVMPCFYQSLAASGAMERFAAPEESYPGEPMRVDGELTVVYTEYVEPMVEILGAE